MMRPLLIILAIFFVSCRGPSSVNENDSVTIIREVQNTLDDYYSDIRKSGLKAEFQYLDSSKDFFWVPPGYSHAISYDSVVKVLEQNVPLFRSIDNSFDTLRIVPLSKELATYTGRLHSTMTDTSGIVTTVSLIETGVIIKRKDKWKLLSGQTSVLNNN